MLTFLYCLNFKIGLELSLFNCNSKHHDKGKFVLKLSGHFTAYNLNESIANFVYHK